MIWTQVVLPKNSNKVIQKLNVEHSNQIIKWRQCYTRHSPDYGHVLQWVCRDRDKDRQRQRQRQTETETETETDRGRDRQRQRQTETSEGHRWKTLIALATSSIILWKRASATRIASLLIRSTQNLLATRRATNAGQATSNQCWPSVQVLIGGEICSGMFQ